MKEIFKTMLNQVKENTFTKMGTVTKGNGKMTCTMGMGLKDIVMGQYTKETGSRIRSTEKAYLRIKMGEGGSKSGREGPKFMRS